METSVSYKRNNINESGSDYPLNLGRGTVYLITEKGRISLLKEISDIS